MTEAKISDEFSAGGQPTPEDLKQLAVKDLSQWSI